MVMTETVNEKSMVPVPVEIRGSKGDYQLFRGGEPYFIKGAGIQSGELEAFAMHGGNSFRTWSADGGMTSPKELLDSAHALGLTVALGLPFQKEVWGMDYDDEAMVAAQLAKVKEVVTAHRDHPALLAWIIGNELNWDYTNPKVYDAVNEASKLIHELDPHHPTTTTTASISASLLKDIVERAPDLDFLSIQVYGAADFLPKYVEQLDFPMPLMITEWGTIGHWEIEATDWGAPPELTSSEKAANYLRVYNEILMPLRGHIIGDYVFLWGQKQEKTPTWYGMFTADGEETEAIDVMEYAWTGNWPANRAPAVNGLRLAGQVASDSVKLAAGGAYAVEVMAGDPDGDALSYEWFVKREALNTPGGGAPEAVPEVLDDLIDTPTQPSAMLTAPQEPGQYRIFVTVRDGNNHAGHGNIPFLVKQDESQ